MPKSPKTPKKGKDKGKDKAGETEAEFDPCADVKGTALWVS